MIEWKDIDFPPINLWNLKRYERKDNKFSYNYNR